MSAKPGPAPLDGDETRDYWVGRAPVWVRLAPEIERMTGRFNGPLVEAAEVGAGMRVLDLASGAGEPAMTLARAVGPSGAVVATDLVAEMVTAARRRAAAAGLSHLRFETADMQDLPFGDASFDRVVCRFGIMFAPEPGRALREALRVLKPGGRSAWMVWGPLADTTVFAVLQREVRAFLDLPRDVALPQFRFGEAGLLARSLKAAGFASVTERDLYFDGSPPVGSAFWNANLEMSFAEETASLSPERRAALDAHLEKAFAAHLSGDRYAIRAHVRIGAGVRAAPGEV